MKQTLALHQVPGFGKLLLDFLTQNTLALPNDAFDKKNLENLLNYRAGFNHRSTLVDELKAQNKHISLTDLSLKNIELLGKSNTVSVTTGHQLSLLGGPLFVAHKILTTVQLCQKYSQQFPEYNFVPVFWMATEDHDKEEINNFALYGKKYTWETPQNGAVGEFTTDGIDTLLAQIVDENNGLNTWLVETLKAAYQQPNLSNANRFLMNALFGEYGLVIVDGNSKTLKKLLVPIIEKEINEKLTHTNVTKQNTFITEKGFTPAIDPRELNLFYLTPGERKRLIFDGENIKTVDHSTTWTKQSFITFANTNPEQISPNVLLRPVYQETILPNIAYVGGPAETEYWLQLDRLFTSLNYVTPLRILRLCNTMVTQKQWDKIQTTEIPLSNLFENDDNIAKWYTQKAGGENLDFNAEKDTLATLFQSLAQKAKHIDPTLEPAVLAEKARQEKALENVFAKIAKTEKNKNETSINQLLKIKNSLLPNGTPQERTWTLAELNIALPDFFNHVLMLDLNVMNLSIG